ncbi:MAG TPA: TAT-variant-translocated molybdopterin oxidoreductase [Planctomycetota bacterium]|nr:TAT-variant-translocated molybdopterin oxidoreductase [Planctomycetota bacterium]
MAETPDTSLTALRAKLASGTGKAYWRSLEELADAPEFIAMLQREFPREASVMESMSRATFLKLMGASLALAGLAGCGERPAEKIIPYVQQPEQILQGKPLFYATALTLGGFARGVLVESNLGRPTKIEGNPEHPASLGATDVFMQAAILSLWDPDRSQTLTHLDRVATWETFVNWAQSERERLGTTRGAGLRLLTENITSPTLLAHIGALKKQLPEMHWHQYQPVCAGGVRSGIRQAFGRDAHPIYHFERADVVLSLDADFLSSGAASVRYARDFASRRRVRAEQVSMNRLYAVECTPSPTGAGADHRIALKPSHVEAFTRELAAELKIKGVQASPAPSGVRRDWIAAIARDLQRSRGRCVIVPGDYQPAAVHAIAHAMNAALENIGKTVSFIEPPGHSVDEIQTLRDLCDDIDAGKVETLVILGGNPVFTAPSDLQFAVRLQKVRQRVHLSAYHDETSRLCQWHIPQAHELETWSDARAFDGTATIQQPLIAPLFHGRSPHAVLSVLLGQPYRTDYEIVREQWRSTFGEGTAFDEAWNKAVHDGVVPDSAARPLELSLQANIDFPPQAPGNSLEIVFRPDPHIYDGRFANNGWLQELPKPLSKLTWDNAALMSPLTAERLKISREMLIDIRTDRHTVRAPVWVLPGHPDDCITLHFGYGRTRAGRVGSGTGVNVFPLRVSSAMHFAVGASVKATAERYALACTQNHHSMEGRDIIRSVHLQDFGTELPHEEGKPAHEQATLLPKDDYVGNAWGMVIDQTVCTGCSACVLGCQSENNIPVVGKQQVLNSREMHWLRIDRYYQGPFENPEPAFQPMLCQHCEKAPCEIVCPVAATTHSSEGLNEMTYNRCIGTRYCSNNCPYKVRRFNFLDYNDAQPTTALMKNPEVTIRERGVMEKCTYCVQRINRARTEASIQNRPIRDGEVVTACQAACPAEAIIFGNINDPESRVAKLKKEPHNYGVLTELNTLPRTSYLARVRNPNPEMLDGKSGPVSEAAAT